MRPQEQEAAQVKVTQTDKTQTKPLIQQSSQSLRRAEDYKKRQYKKEALATPFKDGAEELDDDLENSEEEAATPGYDRKAPPSVPASASKEGHVKLFNLGKTTNPKRSGLRPPSQKGGKRKTPKKRNT